MKDSRFAHLHLMRNGFSVGKHFSQSFSTENVTQSCLRKQFGRSGCVFYICYLNLEKICFFIISFQLDVYVVLYHMLVIRGTLARGLWTALYG